MRGAPVGSPAVPPNWPGASGIAGSTYGNENGTASGPVLAIFSRRTPQAGTATLAASNALRRTDRRRCTSASPRSQTIVDALQPGARAVLGRDGGALRVGVFDQARRARGVRALRVVQAELLGALLRVGHVVHLQQRLHGEELALGGQLAVRELAPVILERGERARRRRRQRAAALVDERHLARERI